MLIIAAPFNLVSEVRSLESSRQQKHNVFFYFVTKCYLQRSEVAVPTHMWLILIVRWKSITFSTNHFIQQAIH